jgi:hypothetical protein
MAEVSDEDVRAATKTLVDGNQDAWAREPFGVRPESVRAVLAQDRERIFSALALDSLQAIHAREWWATYRAALAGLCASSPPRNGGHALPGLLHDSASAIADRAHGPLPKDPA